MEFKNLDCNILSTLSEKESLDQDPGRYEFESVYRSFPDLPKENVKKALFSLAEQGLIMMDDDKRQIAFTAKALFRLKAYRQCLRQETGMPGTSCMPILCGRQSSSCSTEIETNDSAVSQ